MANGICVNQSDPLNAISISKPVLLQDSNHYNVIPHSNHTLLVTWRRGTTATPEPQHTRDPNHTVVDFRTKDSTKQRSGRPRRQALRILFRVKHTTSQCILTSAHPLPPSLPTQNNQHQTDDIYAQTRKGRNGVKIR